MKRGILILILFPAAAGVGYIIGITKDAKYHDSLKREKYDLINMLEQQDRFSPDLVNYGRVRYYEISLIENNRNARDYGPCEKLDWISKGRESEVIYKEFIEMKR